jgi:hypothetical protein
MLIAVSDGLISRLEYQLKLDRNTRSLLHEPLNESECQDDATKHGRGRVDTASRLRSAAESASKETDDDDDDDDDDDQSTDNGFLSSGSSCAGSDYGGDVGGVIVQGCQQSNV